MDGSEFVERLDFLLKKRNLKRLALSDIGIPPQTITNWKRRNNMPTLDVAERIADFFGLSIDELIQKKRKKNDFFIEEEEVDLLKKYRILPKNDKELVGNLVDNLHSRVVAEAELPISQSYGDSTKKILKDTF